MGVDRCRSILSSTSSDHKMSFKIGAPLGSKRLLSALSLPPSLPCSALSDQSPSPGFFWPCVTIVPNLVMPDSFDDFLFRLCASSFYSAPSGRVLANTPGAPTSFESSLFCSASLRRVFVLRLFAPPLRRVLAPHELAPLRLFSALPFCVCVEPPFLFELSA